MTCVGQWPTRRPFWAVWLAAAVGVPVLSSVGYCFPAFFAVPVTLWLVWRFSQYWVVTPFVAETQLRANLNGSWELGRSNERRALSLMHVWPAFGWVTLRFRDLDAVGPKDTMLEITIWKSSVSPDAWRRLNVLVASKLARRELVATAGK